MKINFKFLSVFFIILFVLLVPAVSLAQDLIPCGLGNTDDCDFYDLLTLLQNVINFVLFVLAVPAAVLGFVYAGFLYLWGGAKDPGAIGQAKSIFYYTVIGFVLALAAYLLVTLIVGALVQDASTDPAEAIRESVDLQ